MSSVFQVLAFTPELDILRPAKTSMLPYAAVGTPVEEFFRLMGQLAVEDSGTVVRLDRFARSALEAAKVAAGDDANATTPWNGLSQQNALRFLDYILKMLAQSNNDNGQVVLPFRGQKITETYCENCHAQSASTEHEFQCCSLCLPIRPSDADTVEHLFRQILAGHVADDCGHCANPICGQSRLRLEQRWTRPPRILCVELWRRPAEVQFATSMMPLLENPFKAEGEAPAEPPNTSAFQAEDEAPAEPPNTSAFQAEDEAPAEPPNTSAFQAEDEALAESPNTSAFQAEEAEASAVANDVIQIQVNKSPANTTEADALNINLFPNGEAGPDLSLTIPQDPLVEDIIVNYDLYAIVKYQEQPERDGGYVTCVLDDQKTGSKQWYLCKDEFVTPITTAGLGGESNQIEGEADTIKTGLPYLLFYRERLP